MRLSPGVGGVLPRDVLLVEGNLFPEGTVVATCHYSIHHNEAYYPDPFTFNPHAGSRIAVIIQRPQVLN